MVSSATLWARRQREKNIELLGGKCSNRECGSTEDLEFHHLAETETKGRGRGSVYRARDVRKHPFAYTLLCRTCHKKEHPDRFPSSVQDEVDDMEAQFRADHPEAVFN